MPCPSTGPTSRQGRKVCLARALALLGGKVGKYPLPSLLILSSDLKPTAISLKLIKFISLQYCHNVTLCLPRRLFKEPEVTPASDVELKWEKPDEEELVNFMVTEKGFSVRKL